MFLKSSLLMTSGLGFDTYVREEVREERVQVKKPHVILIMTDQHRGDALGCMGNSAVISPNLDRLAKEGTLFVNGYSASPSSTPARAGLLACRLGIMACWGMVELQKSIRTRCRKCYVISGIIHLVLEKCTGFHKRLFMAFIQH